MVIGFTNDIMHRWPTETGNNHEGRAVTLSMAMKRVRVTTMIKQKK